jgi:hypothetical protein
LSEESTYHCLTQVQIWQNSNFAGECKRSLSKRRKRIFSRLGFQMSLPSANLSHSKTILYMFTSTIHLEICRRLAALLHILAGQDPALELPPVCRSHPGLRLDGFQPTVLRCVDSRFNTRRHRNEEAGLLKCIPVVPLNAIMPIADLRALFEEIFTGFNGRRQQIPVEGSGGLWLRKQSCQPSVLANL